MSQILGDSAEGEYARAYFYRMRREHQRSTELMRLAIDQYPNDTALRQEFLRNHFGSLARGEAAPEIGEVAAGLSGPSRDLLAAARAAVKSDWGAVAEADGPSRGFRWADLSDSGVAELSDFMPVEDAGVPHNLVRRAKTVRGEIRFAMRCDPRFDYARGTHTVERRGESDILFVGRSGARELVLRLRSSVALELEEGAAVAEFTLGADESAWFVLEVVTGNEPSPCENPDYAQDAFKATVNFWRGWIGRSTYKNRWREMVNRSALVLKLLTSREHGSTVAAPTFGLPETIGGVRNWDYRYCWIRDSSFSLYGMMRLGYTGEAESFMRWMLARAQELEPDGSLQIMYKVDGRPVMGEETLDHFEGYLGSRPVRIGNDAHTHLQLDIYGELMDSVYLYDKYGRAIAYDAWINVVRLIDWVCDHWREKDESIWEVRGGRREFLYSRVMCWVAIDRALRLANRRSLPAPSLAGQGTGYHLP